MVESEKKNTKYKRRPFYTICSIDWIKWKKRKRKEKKKMAAFFFFSSLQWKPITIRQAEKKKKNETRKINKSQKSTKEKGEHTHTYTNIENNGKYSEKKTSRKNSRMNEWKKNMGLNQQNTKQSKSINGCFTHTCITQQKKIDLSLWYKQTKRIEYLHTHTHEESEREKLFSNFHLLNCWKKTNWKKTMIKSRKKREKSKKKRKEKPPTTTTTTKYTILMAIQGHFIIIHDGSKGIKYECFFFYFPILDWEEEKKNISHTLP